MKAVVDTWAVLFFQVIGLKIGGDNGHMLFGVSFRNDVDNWRVYHSIHQDLPGFLSEIVYYHHRLIEQAVVVIILLFELLSGRTQPTDVLRRDQSHCLAV